MRLHDLARLRRPGAGDVLEVIGDPSVEVRAITHDSRRVPPGALFACIRGERADGHRHAPEAVAAGAVALLVERHLDLGVPEIVVPDVRSVLGPLAARLHGDPSPAMRVLGVTGTNGKTTVVALLDAIARAAGEETAVIGTLGASLRGRQVDLGFTTPEATDLQELLAECRDAGVRTVAMEVSSHALAQHRVDGVQFAAVCFTNLSHEHQDLHGSLDAYRDAKARLFTRPFARHAAINLDDPVGRSIAAHARAGGLDVVGYGTSGDAAVAATDVRLDATGATFTLRLPGHPGVKVRTRLLGAFNVMNALAAGATASIGGFAVDAIVDGLARGLGAPGRLEPVEAGQPFTVLVDYAHTPAALAAAVRAARDVADAGRVILVFGCGGDRDPTKRAPMGEAAAGADLAVLTSDNPRSEDPRAIADAAEAGLRAAGAAYEVELDRRRAIRRAISLASGTDVVVIAGKGHETGQVQGGVTTPFDDRAVAREELEALRCA